MPKHRAPPPEDLEVVDPNPGFLSSEEMREWGEMGEKGEEDQTEYIHLGTVRETPFLVVNREWFDKMVTPGTELTVERRPHDLLGFTTTQLVLPDSTMRLALIEPLLAKHIVPLLDGGVITVRAIANDATARIDATTREVTKRVYTYDLQVYGQRHRGRLGSMSFLYPLRTSRITKFAKRQARAAEQNVVARETARFNALKPSQQRAERLRQMQEEERMEGEDLQAALLAAKAEIRGGFKPTNQGKTKNDKGRTTKEKAATRGTKAKVKRVKKEER